MTDRASQIVQEKEPTRCLPFLMRLFWIFFGSALLIFFTISITRQSASIIVDVALWLTVIVLVSIRYVDIRWFNGQTADAEPATLRNWRQYTIRLLLASGALYTLARLAAHSKLL
jgi:hypothetical protein